MCAQAHEIGYSGLELAPNTLAEDATRLSPEQRRELGTQISDAGLEFVGLHWLLVSPPGLHITVADESTHKRSWEYVHRAIDLCADLAGRKPAENGVIVFGSPKQRSTTRGMNPRQALDSLTHELAHAAGHAEANSVTLLLEAIPARDTDVVNTLADAVAVVRQIGSPAVQTMFDVHNAADETDTHSDLVRRYITHIRHIHVNEADGKEPGKGAYDFESLLGTLSELNYSGWVSVEAFDFSRNPHEIAAGALARLRSAAPSLTSV